MSEQGPAPEQPTESINPMPGNQFEGEGAGDAYWARKKEEARLNAEMSAAAHKAAAESPIPPGQRHVVESKDTTNSERAEGFIEASDVPTDSTTTPEA